MHKHTHNAHNAHPKTHMVMQKQGCCQWWPKMHEYVAHERRTRQHTMLQCPGAKMKDYYTRWLGQHTNPLKTHKNTPTLLEHTKTLKIAGAPVNAMPNAQKNAGQEQLHHVDIAYKHHVGIWRVHFLTSWSSTQSTAFSSSGVLISAARKCSSFDSSWICLRYLCVVDHA